MTLSEKSAYLKGLMDGLKLDTEKDEGKMIAAIVDMLSDVAETVADLEDVVDCDLGRARLHRRGPRQHRRLSARTTRTTDDYEDMTTRTRMTRKTTSTTSATTRCFTR